MFVVSYSPLSSIYSCWSGRREKLSIYAQFCVYNDMSGRLCECLLFQNCGFFISGRTSRFLIRQDWQTCRLRLLVMQNQKNCQKNLRRWVVKQGFRIGKFLSCTNADSPVCVMICKGRLCEEKEVEPNADNGEVEAFIVGCTKYYKAKGKRRLGWLIKT